MEELNVSAWLTGVYVSNSIAAVLGENGKYPEEPIQLFKTDAPEETEDNNADAFSAYAVMFNKEYRKNHPEKNTESDATEKV